MTSRKRFEPERRRYYRMSLKRYKSGRVEFLHKGEVQTEARLLDIGGGGLRCSVSRDEIKIPKENEYYERLHVYSSLFGQPLIFSGLVRRVRPLSGRQGIEIGLEFSAILSSFSPIKPSAAEEEPGELSTISQSAFIARLQQIDSFAKVKDVTRRGQKRADLHEYFKDIALHLPEEDRWWFYCVVTSLKNTGVQYQKGLLAEYLNLCKRSIDPQSLRDL